MHSAIAVIPGTNDWCLREDGWISKECIRQGRLDWDRSFAELPEVKRLGPEHVVVDVGAFIGDTTRIFTARGCKVLALEPQADAYACLVHNCQLPLCQTWRVAVGNLTGKLRLHGGRGGNMGARGVVFNEGAEEVECIRLDDVHLPRCDFLKIDVEGFEPRVLDGAREFLRRHRPVIHIENNDHGLMRYGFRQADVTQHLLDLKYDIREVSRCDPMQWDAICTPRS